MPHAFHIGDPVSWNSEAGRIHGKVTKRHTSDFEFMGRTRRASSDEPQYEVKSDNTGHLAAHKESALSKLSS